MAIKWLSTAWKDDLKTRVFPTDRIYIDFRQELYPPYAGELMKVNVVEGFKIGEEVLSERVKEILEGIKIGEIVTGDTV